MATAMYTISFNAMADEGMWLPSLISQRIGDMQAKGFRLTAEDIYSINQASLKDAVVLFGSGCTGELISPEGLLITNHHCGYGQIQRHSSVEHDYLRDGFWAMSREEELPNEGLEVRFLDRMEDVTDIVLKGYEEGMSEEQRDSLVKANSRELISKATAGGKGLEADVVILLDVDKTTFEQENVLIFYVGTSRARIKLEIAAILSDDDCKEILTSVLNYQGKIRRAKTTELSPESPLK